MTWFEILTGFREESPQQVRENIMVDGEILKSHINNKIMSCGLLEIPRLVDLRQRVLSENIKSGKISVREVVGNVQVMALDWRNYSKPIFP